MLHCAGGDLFERVSKSEYRLTEAKCQIFMRQILRHTFQYPSSASLVFFIAPFILRLWLLCTRWFPYNIFFQEKMTILRCHCGLSILMVYGIWNYGLFGVKGIASRDGLGFCWHECVRSKKKLTRYTLSTLYSQLVSVLTWRKAFIYFRLNQRSSKKISYSVSALLWAKSK